MLTLNQEQAFQSIWEVPMCKIVAHQHKIESFEVDRSKGTSCHIKWNGINQFAWDDQKPLNIVCQIGYTINLPPKEMK